jgi:hypothetical protein
VFVNYDKRSRQCNEDGIIVFIYSPGGLPCQYGPTIQKNSSPSRSLFTIVPMASLISRQRDRKTWNEIYQKLKRGGSKGGGIAMVDLESSLTQLNEMRFPNSFIPTEDCASMVELLCANIPTSNELLSSQLCHFISVLFSNGSKVGVATQVLSTTSQHILYIYSTHSRFLLSSVGLISLRISLLRHRLPSLLYIPLQQLVPI